VRAGLTTAELQRWEEHGGTWRVTEITDQRVQVELCSCYGEPVDMRVGESLEVIEYVRRAQPV
jgi:hypothetical protein